MLMADCTSIEKVDLSSHDNTKRNNLKEQKNLQSTPHHAVRKNLEDALTLPTSDPPNFIESYNMGFVTTPSPDKFSITIPSSFTRPKTSSHEYSLTKFSFEIPKLPTHPHYTFTLTTEEPPTREPTTFWSVFFSAGFQNSKDLQLGDVDVNTTPDYDHPPAILELDDEYKNAEVALQSVFGLNNTDQADTIKLLDKVEKVIGNIKSVFEGKSIIRPSNDDEKLEKFTDFIHNLIKRLKTYDDKDVEYFITIFNDEIRKYNYKGCKFHELLENYNLRRFLSNMISKLQNQSGATIKNSLEVIANKIEDDKFNKNEKNLVDFINSVYRQDSVKKFQNFLTQIDTYKLNSDTKDRNLVKIIKEGVRSIIFDYYSQLNNNARNALKHQVNDFWNNLSQNESFQLENSFKSSRTQNFRYKIKKKNNLNPKEIFDSKPDLKNNIIKSEVKKQSIYLLNSIKAPKSDKRFRNDEHVYINQTTQSDHEFIDIKKQKQNDNSGLQTISPLIFTTRLLKARRQVLTFKTLYPDLVPEWTSVTQFPSRRFMSYESPVRHHNAEKRKLFRKRGRVKGRRLVKKSDDPSEVSVRNSRMPRMKKKSLTFGHKVPVKKIGLRSRKPVASRHLTTYKTKRQKRIRPLRTNMELRTSKRRRLGIRRHSLFTQIENNYRRSNIIDSMVSEEGLSIDLPEVHEDNFRRSETNFTHPDPGLHHQMTQSIPANVNNEIHKTTVTISDINNALSNEKYKFIKSKEEQNDRNVERLNKVQKTFQIKSKAEDKNLTEVEIIKAFEVNTQANNNWDAHKIFNEEKYQTVNNNEQTDHFNVQNKQDESSIFNFRAKHTGNETEIESKRNDQNKNMFISELNKYSKAIELKRKDDIRQSVFEKKVNYDENQLNKDIKGNNVKTDNDFKSFIEDYGNSLNELTHYKIRNNRVTVNSELANNIEKDIDTGTTPKATLSSTTTTSVTESPTTSAPTVVTTLLPPIGPSTISSVNEKQNLDKTSINSFFDANFIKLLMKTKTQQTTTPNSAAGRYFNHDGVIMDSMEKLKEEVAEATNLNYEEQ
ncbi:unnamed protein product [Arctia plantaginis]|uniref:Uncharacterized protein n=1 Tax=Arctia plantaginis TaxID=874455 RepID=A0A8S1AZS2_ARCPL|nr:unnamed protein product [Arctia plantaginis]